MLQYSHFSNSGQTGTKHRKTVSFVGGSSDMPVLRDRSYDAACERDGSTGAVRPGVPRRERCIRRSGCYTSEELFAVALLLHISAALLAVLHCDNADNTARLTTLATRLLEHKHWLLPSGEMTTATSCRCPRSAGCLSSSSALLSCSHSGAFACCSSCARMTSSQQILKSEFHTREALRCRQS